MKRFLSVIAILALVLCSTAAFANVETDEDGGIWDYDKGIYTDPEGQQHAIENTDGGSSGSGSSSGGASTGTSDASGGMVVSSSDGSEDPTAGMQKNADGSVTIESGTYGTPDEGGSGTGQHLTEEEWAARWNKYTAKNGTTTGTVYMDDAGAIHPAEILHLGLGRSTILVEEQELIVPTSSLRWDTEAPEDMVLAVVTPSTQSYITLRAKSSQKAFVMGHCNKCKVLRVIRTGKTWTFVDDEGVRGYVMTSGLTFFSNSPKNYVTGIITINGKVAKGKDHTVHVRSSGSNKAKQIAEYPAGTELTVFSLEGDWYEVDVAGLHCYIHNKFVTLNEPLIMAEAEGTEPEPGLAPLEEGL